MATNQRQHRTQLRAAQAAGLALALGICTHGPLARAQADAGWLACVATADSTTRLACFDRWAQNQATTPSAAATNASPTSPATATVASPVQAQMPATRVISITSEEGCRDRQYSELSRFWELESGSDCGTFNIRGYRPISLSLIGSDDVNRQPTSGNPANVAGTAQPHRTTETRIQLSVRTKIAQGLLTANDPARKDSLWFGYTQQSYWQLFTGSISRPFRSTDHEPEVVYVYPADAPLPGGWRLRYGGIGVVHQSNGQSLPYSRSWNRAYLMAGMEQGNRFSVQGRVWKRLPEDAATDDNPGISDYIGRAELSAAWAINPANTLGVTLRHSLSSARRGSARLEWLRTLGSDAQSGLRLHTQLFSGYGDSLLDYNRRRTVFSLGLSLVDW